MNIEDLKARVYFLAGQLEEAKKMFNDAVQEIERENKQLAKSKEESVQPEPVTAN